MPVTDSGGKPLREAREKLGSTNIVVMIPFCRTPKESDRVLDQLASTV